MVGYFWVELYIVHINMDILSVVASNNLLGPYLSLSLNHFPQ